MRFHICPTQILAILTDKRVLIDRLNHTLLDLHVQIRIRQDVRPLDDGLPIPLVVGLPGLHDAVFLDFQLSLEPTIVDEFDVTGRFRVRLLDFAQFDFFAGFLGIRGLLAFVRKRLWEFALIIGGFFGFVVGESGVVETVLNRGIDISPDFHFVLAHVHVGVGGLVLQVMLGFRIHVRFS